MTPEDDFDYQESLIAVCRVPGCNWSLPIVWSDLDMSEPGGSSARRAHAEHWAETHAGDSGGEQ